MRLTNTQLARLDALIDRRVAGPESRERMHGICKIAAEYPMSIGRAQLLLQRAYTGEVFSKKEACCALVKVNSIFEEAEL